MTTTVKKPDPFSDFRNFLYVVWKHLGLPDPTPAQYDIAYYLQHGPRRLIIEAFRGVGKSWITVAYVVWRLYREPQMKIMVVSASKNLADNFSTFALQLIESMDMLQHLRPRANQRNSKIQFDVGPSNDSKDPSLKSVGITGQITGSRADLIIPDDIESLNNSITQQGRDRLLELVKEFDAVLKPGGEIRYLGTPQTEMSIYNQLPGRGYSIRIWPARVPDEKQKARYGDRLSAFISALPYAPGDPVDPQRFSHEDLVERELSYGRSGFALQYMLDTSLSDQDRYPLKINDLIVMDVDNQIGPQKLVWAQSPELAWDSQLVPCVGFNGDRYYRPMQVVQPFLDYQGCVLAIDPSGRGADESGYCVLKMLNGYLFCVAAGGLRGGYAETNLEFLAKLAKEHGANRIIIESNFGDGMFTALLKPVLQRIYPCTCEEIRHSTQKEKRIIDTLEPILNRHRLVIDPKVIKRDWETAQAYPPEKQHQYMLFHQLSRITKEKGALAHDDRLDALAMAVSYWTDRLSQDEDSKIEAHKEELLAKDLERFMENVFGRKTQANTWVKI